MGCERVGWTHLPVSMRFNACSGAGRLRLRLEASLRRWRLFSARYASERAWVERWLHMIDRSLTKQPAAASAIAGTAAMIQGSGDGYRRGLADWHALIDGVVSIWTMSTPERFRRQGYARALLETVLAEAVAEGAHTGVLGATPAGFPLYDATGWKTVDEWQLFLRAS